MQELARQKRQYQKVPSHKRKELINNVIKKGETIKKAAKLLNIKYAAAKSIIENQRKKQIKKFRQSLNQHNVLERCSFRKLNKESTINYSILVYQFGEVIQMNKYFIKV